MIGLGLIFLSSCKTDDPEPIVYGDASVRVVNAVPGSAAQDFYQGGTKVSTTAVAYGNYSDYLTIKGGNSTIQFKNTGTTTLTAQSPLGAETGSRFTVFYFTDGTGAGQVRGFGNDPTAVAGKVKIRFYNLGSAFGSTPISVTLAGGTGLLSGLTFPNVSGYGNIDAGVDLSVTLLGSAPFTISGNQFVAGKIYTVWFDAASATAANYHIIQEN